MTGISAFFDPEVYNTLSFAAKGDCSILFIRK